MAAPEGNNYWEMRASNKGAAPKYENPEDLWAACVEYFQWMTDTPLEAAEKVTFQGEGKTFKVPKMRAMTQQSLCVFIGIARSTWYDWKENREDVADIIARVEDIIFAQKFEGAAADMLNPNIIARELGLSEKIGGDPDAPIKVDTDERDLARKMAFLLKKGSTKE